MSSDVLNSLGITTLPKLSSLRTIPVDFINESLHICKMITGFDVDILPTNYKQIKRV